MSTVFPLGPEQRSMLYLDRLFGPGVAHNLLAVVPVGDAGRDQVAEALARLEDLHAGLRAQIADDERRWQRIGAQRIELGDAPDGDRRRALERRRLDRSAEPRACAELDDDGHLLIAFDHFICDADARRTLVSDIRALLDGRPPLPQGISLERYCAERDQDTRSEVEYTRWHHILKDTVPLTGLSTRARVEPSWRAVTWLTRWTDPGARQAATTLHLSPFAVVATALAVCLWRRTGIPASALVTPISTRHRDDLAHLVTTLVNERPIAYHIDPDETFGALLTRVGGNSLRAIRNARLSWPELIDNVAEYRALFHTRGAEYIQLQAQLIDDPPRDAKEELEVVHPYKPAADVTCTVIRVYIGREVTAIRAFFGGPVGGEAWIPEVLEDLVGLLTTVPRPDTRVRDLAWTARPADRAAGR